MLRYSLLTEELCGADAGLLFDMDGVLISSFLFLENILIATCVKTTASLAVPLFAQVI